MKPRQKHVLLALGWYDYRLHRGIERFAQEHGWCLSANLTREKVIPWGWDGNGILAWLGAGDDLAEFVVHAQKLTVDFSFRRPHLAFPRVLEDHAAAARLVADHFLVRGFMHFLYYSDTRNWSYEERGQGFVQALQQAGRICAWLRWRETDNQHDMWQRRRRWLVQELKKASKPVAVFAANDDHALEVMGACEQAGLAVPDQVALMGAENYLLAPDAMHTPISSVDTNLELMGYTGAQLLDQLMQGKKPPRNPIRIPPSGIVTRKSSDLLALNHKGVANSLRFLWEHCHEPIGVEDLARAAAMSRRGLHQAFLEHVGRPPGHELQRVRIERSKKLLRETDQKMEAVAEQCGYRSANSFWCAFKQVTGVSPRAFRQNRLSG